jgi:hypothetical protein
MIIILGRRDEPSRVITGVTDYFGNATATHIGWWRPRNKLGLGFTIGWMKSRYTHGFVVEPTKTHPGKMTRLF